MEKKNNLDPQYNNLLKDILENGIKKQTRNGEVLSLFGKQIRHDMKDGFPLLTGKKMFFKGIVTELLWFLRGDTNIKYLLQNDCNIWNGDAYKNYVSKQTTEDVGSMDWFIEQIKTDNEFAKKWGELGPIYGKQWRSWPSIKRLKLQYPNSDTIHNAYPDYGDIDQIQNLINELKTNPDSRRLMVSAWNVGELDQMVLPPCHYGFQVYTRELSGEERVEYFNNHPESWPDNEMSKVPKRAISLMWNQRSVDTFLGLPFNIASYGLLLEMIAKEVNMVPDELIGNLGDVHLYSNHIEQAKEQIGRKLTVEERMDWWFKNRKPNRDVCDHVDDLSPYAKGVYFDSVGVPKSTREPYPLPTVTLPSGLEPGLGHWDKVLFEDFYLNDYKSHPAIKAHLSN